MQGICFIISCAVSLKRKKESFVLFKILSSKEDFSAIICKVAKDSRWFVPNPYGPAEVTQNFLTRFLCPHVFWHEDFFLLLYP